MTHTPGPWAYDAESGQIVAPKVGYHHVTPPIICTIEPLQYGEDAGNGALIAAAPKLLEALKLVMTFFGRAEWEDRNGNDFTPKLNKARAALAAANGEKA